MSIHIKKVHEIKEGDSFFAGDALVWTAEEDVRVTNHGDDVDVQVEVTLKVRYADGGLGRRHWDDPNIQLTIETRGH